MLIGVMRFCEEENEELFINEYQLKTLLQNATITLEELKNELVIFKEECDRNERLRLRDIRVKTGFDSNVILQIAKYLSLNDAINTFSFDILPLLHRTQAKVQLVEPSDRLIKLILRKLNSSQVVSLRFNTEERLSNASSNLLSIFNQVMSISLINHHSIHELLFYKIPFLNITSLSLWYDYEIAFDAVRDMIIRLPERIKRFHLYSPGIFCVHYSPNQIYPASSIYFTLEYLLIDMSYFPFVSQNDCMQNYSSCLLMTIIDLHSSFSQVTDKSLFFTGNFSFSSVNRIYLFICGKSTIDSLMGPANKPKAGNKNVNQIGVNPVDLHQQTTATTTAGGGGTMAFSEGSTTTKANSGTKAGLASRSKFNIAPLVLEGVKLNKLQLNDMIKQQFKDLRISDIQLSRAGIFTIQASDVNSFNRLLNELTPLLATNSQDTCKIYVPRSIQRVKDTEKVAFVKNVDIEIPEGRIIEALKDVGLNAIDVVRLTNKDRTLPIRTIKIIFADVQNRNTFVHTGLQVDSMHFVAESANQTTKPVQCYMCLKYNHVAKYCKTKQQLCARCGGDHRVEQCTAASDVMKCSNCSGSHLATSNECLIYKQQEKRLLNLVNQYSSTSKPIQRAPALYNNNEFPSLPNNHQQQNEQLQKDFLEQIVNALSSKIETLIEATTNRLFKTLANKIKKIEKLAGIHSNKKDDDDDDDAYSFMDSSTEEESKVVQHLKNIQQQRQNQQTATATDTPATPTTTTTAKATTVKPKTTTAKATSLKPISNTNPSKKQKKKAVKAAKRSRSTDDSSLNTTINDKKDAKANINDD
ncbi:unnamed protein product [Adineta steineri]|nr:unnamed protein product [Adineta steineri]